MTRMRNSRGMPSSVMRIRTRPSRKPFALIHAARKDADGAFRWLDRAYRQRDAGMLWIKGEPLLKDLRPDPRFHRLLQQMHLD